MEFDIIDASGKIIDHVVTDANGKASTTVNTGNYIVRETKTKQEYSIGVDKSVTVNWNETAELKIENEKKKGKIKIIKQDKDDNSVRLAGVKFKILNEEDECIEKLETDENGEALSKDLVIGDYYIKEVETKDSYVLNNEKIKASVKFNETNEITIENEKIKGKIQINKLSEDKNNILRLINGLNVFYNLEETHKRIEMYLATGNINYFTRQNGIRKFVEEYLPVEQMRAALYEMGWSALVNSIDETYKKYGELQVIKAVERIVDVGSIEGLTNTNNARSYLGFITSPELLQKIILKQASSSINIENQSIEDIAFQVVGKSYEEIEYKNKQKKNGRN